MHGMATLWFVLIVVAIAAAVEITMRIRAHLRRRSVAATATDEAAVRAIIAATHPEPYYAEEEPIPMTKTKKPLTQRCWEALSKHGPATTDALARRTGATSAATSKALAALKARGLTTFARTKKGENVHRAKGKAWPQK